MWRAPLRTWPRVALALAPPRQQHCSTRIFGSVAAAASTPSAAGAPSLRLLQSHVHDPFFNLAFEERLLTGIVEADAEAKAAAASTSSSASSSTASAAAPPAAHTLYLWSNSPCVILGKHQNPHREVHLSTLHETATALVRRQSGGGCVYQDRGNAIFTFVSRDTPHHKEQHNAILLRALERLGVAARASGRNDFETVAEGRKISGCAFKRERGWLLHHGTMLVDVDMAALPKLLSPSKAKLRAKGVESVAARVINLRQINPAIDTATWDQALLQAFVEAHGSSLASTPVEHIRGMEQCLAADPLLSRSYSKLRSWEWVHGHSPEFSHEMSRRFEKWGSVDLCFRVAKGGRIEEAVAYSDALVPAMIDRCNERLAQAKGKQYSREQLDDTFRLAEQDCRESIGQEAANNVSEIRQWLLTQL